MVDILVDAARAGLGPVAIYYALAAVGLNLHFGYTGLLNFGQVGFMLLGAYGLGVSVAIWEWPFLAGIGFAILLAVLLALLMGIPTLRLRADYLAITTIAAAEILRFLTRSTPATDITAGPFGIPSQISSNRKFADAFYDWNPIGEGDYGIGDLTFDNRTMWVMVVGWGLVIAVSLLLAFLMRSPWGRVIKAIREDEDAVRALGKNVFVYKMQSLVIGGVMGGLGGIVLALFQAAISPDFFVPQVTFYAYAILILGGTASTWGPLIGSVLFNFLLQFTDSTMRTYDLVASSDIGAVRFMLVGVALMLLTIFRPQGIAGDREEMMLDA